MIALLGIMIAILTLVAALFAVMVAVVGLFGYQTIRDEAKRIAKDIAIEEARDTATNIATATLNEMWSQLQASDMSESQAEPNNSAEFIVPAKSPHKKRRKATSDENLKEGGGQ